MTVGQTVASRRFDTIAICGSYDHAEAEKNNDSICEPAYLTSAQHFPSAEAMRATLAGEQDAWVYTRLGNPTVRYLEDVLAGLDGYGVPHDVSAAVVSSGMTAVFMATMPFLSLDGGSAPSIVASSACYGGTFMVFSERYARERGITVRWVRDPLSLEDWSSLVDESTRFLYAEVPSNPTLDLADIPALATIAHEAGIPLVVDSTLATPALLRPLGLGADVVVHSLSKGMGSSGMSLAGGIVARHGLVSHVGGPPVTENFADYLRRGPLRDMGCVLSPFNALTILNDVRDVRARMDAMSASALKIAEFLEGSSAIEQVFYPGLPSHRAHALAVRDMVLVDSEDGSRPGLNRFGHMLCFRPVGGAEGAFRVLDRLRLIWRANDLGRVKSTATIPAIATHKQIGDSAADLTPVLPDMVRLSVGLEHVDDLVADLEQAVELR
jgi:O-acetylhomoserine/O-acetylserine sulfhydrylase-like pyridoxal-dependent enzyme